MKKIQFLLFLFFSLLPFPVSAQFQEITFHDLREQKSQVFSFIDYPTEIVRYRGHMEIADSLGETEIFFGETVIATYTWQPGYLGGPMHIKTNLMWSFGGGASILIISPRLEFTEVFVIKDKRIKRFPVNLYRLIKTEIDPQKRILKFTHNNSLTRLKKPDEITEISY